MWLKDALATVLAEAGEPLHSKELTRRVVEGGLWEPGGPTPEATVAAALYSDIKKHGAASRFVRTAANTFGLTDPIALTAGPVVGEAELVGAAELVGEEPVGEVNDDAETGDLANVYEVTADEPAVGAPVVDAPPKKRLSFTDAAADVLARHGDHQPMHYRDITKVVLAEDLVKTEGLTPEATLYAQIITENARAEKRGRPVRFIRHGKGMVGLAEWLEPGVQQEIAKHNADAEEEMLCQLRELHPAHFEQLEGELLRALGINDVEVTAYHGDKGIDVTGVYELAGGMEVRVAVQAKRQRPGVGRPVVQALSGSLKPSEQGLIITTSDFSPGAKCEAARDDKPLIWLISGKQLVKLLIAHDIGARRVPVELVEPTGFDATSGDE